MARISSAQVKRVATLVNLLFCLPLSVGAEEFHRISKYAVDITPRGRVTIDTRVGDVWIEAWEKSRVEVEAEKVIRAGSQKKADRLFGRVRISIKSDDEMVEIRSLYPSRRPWRPFRAESKLGVDYRIKMPSQASLYLKSVNGDVTVEGIGGHAEIQVSYGSVEVTVPSRQRLRLVKARTLLGYVESSLSGQEGAGFVRQVRHWNPDGGQDIQIRVGLGGVWIHSSD